MEKITFKEYSKKIDKIIKKYKGKPIEGMLIRLLEEADKYEIKK